MQIVECGAENGVELAALYNMAISNVPHCYPVSQEDFESLFEGRAGRGLDDGCFLMAREGPSPLGFADFGVAHTQEADVGIVRFLWYLTGHRLAGQRLLEEVESRLTGHGVAKIVAFPQEYRYPFYHLPHAYLSSYLGNVHGLLGINGYRRSRGEIYMDMETISLRRAERPGVEVEVEFNISQSGPLPRIQAFAIHEGREIGSCKNLCCGELHRDERAQSWLFTHSLNVEPSFQGLGVGRYLLARTLQKAKSLGYRHASISTDWNNYRALLFYTNMGYRVVDWTFELAKEPAKE